MPKYYCDYCDVFLTHDSPSVRKSHNDGWKHKAAVRAYYAQFEQDLTQSLIQQKLKEYQEGKGGFPGGHMPSGPLVINPHAPPMMPGGPGGPGMPPRPPVLMGPGGHAMMAGMPPGGPPPGMGGPGMMPPPGYPGFPPGHGPFPPHGGPGGMPPGAPGAPPGGEGENGHKRSHDDSQATDQQRPGFPPGGPHPHGGVPPPGYPPHMMGGMPPGGPPGYPPYGGGPDAQHDDPAKRRRLDDEDGDYDGRQ